MKKVLIFLSFLFCFTVVRGQLAVEVVISNERLLGYGARMHYILGDNVVDSINVIDTFSEYNILNVWGLPLMENYGAIENCMKLDTIRFDLFKFFAENQKHSKAIEKKYGYYNVKIRFLKISEYNYCRTLLNRKYWGSYDVWFKEAGLFTTIPKVLEMDTNNEKLLAQISSALDEIKAGED
jgi:hypothetical protein